MNRRAGISYTKPEKQYPSLKSINQQFFDFSQLKNSRLTGGIPFEIIPSISQQFPKKASEEWGNVSGTGRIGGETQSVVKSLNLGVVEMEKHTLGSLIALKDPSLNLLTLVAIVAWQISVNK